jgi:phage tail sheath protein FI
MATYLSPGVYIEEQDTGPEPIEGVSTSVTGLVGVTQSGPLDSNPPVLVTSFPEYTRTFGSYFTPSFAGGAATQGDTYNLMPHAVAGFFNNGGQLLYIKRVASTATPPVTAAVSNLENLAGAPTLMTRLTASAVPGKSTISVANSRGIQNGTTLTLTQVKNGVTSSSGPLTVLSYNDQQNVITLSAPLPAGVPAVPYYDWQYTTVALTGGAGFVPAPNTSEFLLQAANPGFWGNGVVCQITPSWRTQSQAIGIGNVAPGVNNLILLNSAANFYAGAIVEFNTTTEKFYAKVLNVTGSSIQLVNPLSAAEVTAIHNDLVASPAIPVTVRTCEFDIAASYGTVNESFRGLTLDNTTPYYYATAIANGSSLLSVPFLPVIVPPALPSDQSTQDPSTMPVAPDGLTVILANGTDGAYPLPSDFVGTDSGPGNRTGVQALIDASEISIIAAPGITDQIVQGELIIQCETLLYRFAILDPAPSATGGTPAISDIQAQRNLYDTYYAAIYYPRIVVSDPLSGNPLTISPSGHMAGIYAQTDATRGVWKAPANVVINGILSLETKLSKNDQDVLNPEPYNINALRDFTAQGRGLRVYGARCITSNTEWMYINVRRLFIFIEASLDLGTQWAVFEPNDQQLWNRLIQSVSSFLTTIWQQGGLMGATADQAFFVKCGYDTMSSDDLENGRLIMLVGIAPVFPAEFVIIRIGQWAGGSSVQEL